MALRERLGGLRREHPVFFFGMAAVIGGLLAATLAVASRVPLYRHDSATVEQRMSEREREVRDSILDSRSQRARLAIALLRREMRLESLRNSQLHLAIDLDEGTLALKHGPATLRQTRVGIGQDSLIRAPDGRTWRFVRPLGERYVAGKERSPAYLIPEWVYLSRGEPIPPGSERRVAGGLGEYVIRLDDGTEIYSRPSRGPFANALKPASFVVPEGDMAAVFEAVPVETPVYIF
ncbi:MAG: L,D-transpeptidase [Longimicrobiaceae bacterium]